MNKKEDIPITAGTIIIRWRIVSWWIIPWWRSIIRSPAIDVRIRGIVTTIRILEPATRRWIIINRTTSSWRRTVSPTIIIIIATARWTSITITITTRTVSTRRATTIIVIRGVGSTRHRGSGSGPVTGDIRLSLVMSVDSHRKRKPLTSATQVTRAPLNSRPSSFSTAVLRSAAVSNSTKLLTC